MKRSGNMNNEERWRRLDFIVQLYPGFYDAPPVYHKMTDEELRIAWGLAFGAKCARRNLEMFAKSTEEGHNGEISS
jgi:hypothetical protein